MKKERNKEIKRKILLSSLAFSAMCASIYSTISCNSTNENEIYDKAYQRAYQNILNSIKNGEITVNLIDKNKTKTDGPNTKKGDPDKNKTETDDPNTKKNDPDKNKLNGSGNVEEEKNNKNSIDTDTESKNINYTYSRFDQINDEKIKFASTFGSTSVLKTALDAVIEAWNNKQEVKDKKDGYLPIEITQLNGGYQELESQLNTKLPAKSKDDLYNLTLNYPNVVATLLKYNMHLDLAGETEAQKAVGVLEKAKEIFSDQFLASNYQIAGLQSTENGRDPKSSLWLIPFNKYSQAITVNMPVFAYIIKQATEHNGIKATIKTSDQEFFNKIKTQGTADEVSVEEIWGEYKAVNKENGGLAGFEFSKESFESYDGLFDLASRIKKAFPDADKAGKPINKKADYVLGIDTISNVLYKNALSDVDGDYSKFIFGLTDDKTSVNYNDVRKKGTEQNKIFEKNFNKIAKLLNEQALFIRTSADYSSSMLKAHKLAFAINSTAGYVHNFYRNNDKSYSWIFTSIDEKGKIIEKIVDAKYAYELIAPTAEDKNKGAIAYIKPVNREWKYTLFFGSEGKNNFKPEGKENSYDYKYNEEADEKTKLEVEKLTQGKSANTVVGYYSTDGGLKPDQMGQKFKSWIIPAGQQRGYDIYLIDAKWFKGDYDPNSLTESGFREYQANNTEKLQENELLSLKDAFISEKDDKQNIVLSQGPSLIPIHANEKEDLATINFVKWYISEKLDWQIGHKEYNQLTPLEVFAAHASFIVPTKDVLLQETPSWYNDFNKIAFESFKLASDPKTKAKYTIYEDPADSRSQTFKRSIDEAFGAYMNKTADGEAPETFDEFIRVLNITLGNSFKN
ncbi:P68 family surface lipoprotein [Mesomycoplasma lagogenitalium]|uniref:P80 family lipoprotein n=1 Tax=Mesomycoplasma lagogenitalium TaxID=171286 RepID=A0ABY8LVP1_9BACT|nr:P80 family lipoprotein [Mesomycoplasma lagogenitalium]WGI36855.1 P80 family lipoprotein [Mesomycoplasma lagogenitalium]